MFEPLTVCVRSMTRVVHEADGVQRVQVELADGGSIGIWPGHAPLLAETVAGPVRYADAGGEHQIALDAGLLLVEAGRVLLLAEPLTADSPPIAPMPDDARQSLIARLQAVARGRYEKGGREADDG